MSPAFPNPAYDAIFRAMQGRFGEAYAIRWLEQHLGSNSGTSCPEPLRGPRNALEVSKDTKGPTPFQAVQMATDAQRDRCESPGATQQHPSHRQATKLLEEADHATFDAAYPTMHLLARWSIEHASESDPAPHLMTTYWALEEALGISERELRRHLVEDGHCWSETVRKYIHVEKNYGELLCGKNQDGSNRARRVLTSITIRFFPKTRLSKRAVVKRYGRRDLLEESDAGRTRPTRPTTKRVRYGRRDGRMSAYAPVKKQVEDNNWVMFKVGLTVHATLQEKDHGKPYADIPTRHLLDALRCDLRLAEELALERGANVRRARSRWVDRAARLMAERLGDDQPQPRHEHPRFTTRADGFTDLWRRAIWTSVKAELYGGTTRGWLLMAQMLEHITEGKQLGVKNPVGWAYSRVREELETLRRDYGSGVAGDAPEA